MSGADHLLTLTLEVAVPMWIDRMRHWSSEALVSRARECCDAVAAHGDAILYRVTKGEMRTAEAFNMLAESLGVLAYQPGGVGFQDMHWCAAVHSSGAICATPCAVGDGR